MTLNTFLWITFLALSVACIYLINHYLNLPDDNPIEEAIEQVVYDETNTSVDLTPLSKETK